MFQTTNRYAVRPTGESWMVEDVFTGQAAKPTTWSLLDLSESQANIYCALLNAKDVKRRAAQGKRTK